MLNSKLLPGISHEADYQKDSYKESKIVAEYFCQNSSQLENKG